MSDSKWIDSVNGATPLLEAAQRILDARLGTVAHYLPLAFHEAARDIEHVHQLRVATRRARAALDLFEVCLANGAAKQARKLLRRIRRAAGAARDWDVFLDML